MSDKNRCIFHVVTWVSLITLIILAGGLGFHFFAKQHLNLHSSKIVEEVDVEFPATNTETSWTPSSMVPTTTDFPLPRNDSINELQTGATSLRKYNSGVKRIPMEGSVNEVPNIYKRLGKLPYQVRGDRQYVSTTTQDPFDDYYLPTSTEKKFGDRVTPTKVTRAQTNITTSGNDNTSRLRLKANAEDARLQLENEIVQPGHPTHSNSSYQSEKLSHNLASNGAEAVGEARTPPVYVQSRPVYSKPSPKLPKLPKLLFNPSQLQPKENEINGQGGDPNLVTQTVYGFLDFVTTIGNTVMVFTPQTKKVETPKPSSSEIVIQATSAPSSTSIVPSRSIIVSVSSESVQPPSTPGNDRRGKQIHFEESVPSSLIEASEYEPQVFATSFTSSSSPEFDETTVLESHVVASPIAPSKLKSQSNQVHAPTPFVQVRSEVNVVAATEELQSSRVFVVTPTVTASKVYPASKGFTLKLPQRSSSPVLVTPVSSPLVVVAEKVQHPPPPPPKPSSVSFQQDPNQEESEPTGVVSQTFNTQVEDGVTTVHATKIIGTHIGSQYARIFESSSTVLPVTSSAQVTITPSKAAQAFTSSTARTEEQYASDDDNTGNYENSGEVYSDDDDEAQHVDSPSYDYDAYSQDSQLNDNDEQRLESNEYQDEKGDEKEKQESKEAPSKPTVEPTPTASDEQTHYVLPQQKEKAEIYISPVPNNNAYSRQPQLYVDINPAKSVDFIVTATPSRGKPGRGSRNEYKNRFSNRFTKNSTPSSDVQETKEQERSEDDSGRRTTRFRTRNRSGSRHNSEDVVPTVSVYSQVVSATPTRRFGAGRSKTKEFKPVQSSRSFQPSARQLQISPTSSTSIYRFKLNRPTGRWRFKPSPKPKVNIIKTKEEEEEEERKLQQEQQQHEEVILGENLKDLNVAGSGHNVGPINDEAVQHAESLTYEESRTETNEVGQELEPELIPQTIRVSTVTPTEFEDLDKFLEIATIKSPYVFQAGNVKNTRYITVTKTFTREAIQPTLASSVDEGTIENILATKPPYEKILEGSSDVATLPVIALSSDMATPPLETITQSFSTTQLMLKTSILPVLYDGVTTLYTLTQSYFVTRLVTAHKTVPPVELFQFVPTKSLTEFNTALQEAGSEHSEQLLGSEDDVDPDAQYAHIIAPPDELTSLGADFDPSTMDDKMPKVPSAPRSKGSIGKPEIGGSSQQALIPTNPAANSGLALNGLADQLGLTPEQLAFLQFLKAQKQPTQAPALPTSFFGAPIVPNAAALAASAVAAPALQVTSSPVVVDTTATVVETKTLRIQFGAKPTYTTLYSTKVVPTKMTSYVTMSVAVAPTAAAPIANPFFNPAAFPLAYLG